MKWESTICPRCATAAVRNRRNSVKPQHPYSINSLYCSTPVLHSVVRRAVDKKPLLVLLSFPTYQPATNEHFGVLGCRVYSNTVSWSCRRVRSINPWSKDNNLWQGCIQQCTHTRALWADCHSPYTSLSFKTRCYSSRIGRDRSSWARQAFGYNPPPWYYESFLCRGPSAKGPNCHLLVHTYQYQYYSST